MENVLQNISGNYLRYNTVPVPVWWKHQQNLKCK
jgi:hypothetical protein